MPGRKGAGFGFAEHVRVGPTLQQELDGRAVAVLCRQHERGMAAGIVDIDIGAFIERFPYSLYIAGRRGFRRADVGDIFRNQIGDFRVQPQGCRDRIHAEGIGPLWIGAMFQ